MEMFWANVTILCEMKKNFYENFGKFWASFAKFLNNFFLLMPRKFLSVHKQSGQML